MPVFSLLFWSDVGPLLSFPFKIDPGDDEDGEPLALILNCEYLVRGSILNGRISLTVAVSSLGPGTLLCGGIELGVPMPHTIPLSGGWGGISEGCELIAVTNCPAPPITGSPGCCCCGKGALPGIPELLL